MIDTPEVYIASANAPWPMLNMSFLGAPVETEAELERSLSAAARYFQARKVAWMFFLGEDWLAPALRARAPAVLEAQGMKRALGATGMVAEQLAPPVQPPPRIEIRAVQDVEGARHIADINAMAYDTPLELARGSTALAMFQGEGRGYVGFVEGRPVSVAGVFRIDGVAYVGWVATLAEHRKRGHAEAVMRHGLDEARQLWGLERTALHATDAGRPTYLRMGYRDVARFGFYMPAAPAHGATAASARR